MLESWGCGLYTSAAYTRVFTVMSVLNLKELQVVSTCSFRFVLYCNLFVVV